MKEHWQVLIAMFLLIGSVVSMLIALGYSPRAEIIGEGQLVILNGINVEGSTEVSSAAGSLVGVSIFVGLKNSNGLIFYRVQGLPDVLYPSYPYEVWRHLGFWGQDLGTYLKEGFDMYQ